MSKVTSKTCQTPSVGDKGGRLKCSTNRDKHTMTYPPEMYNEVLKFFAYRPY